MDEPAKKPDQPGTISVTEAARNFSDVVNRARHRGEHFVLTKGGTPVAELRPIAGARLVTGRELAKRFKTAPLLGADEAASLGRDLDEARDALGGPGAGPWE